MKVYVYHRTGTVQEDIDSQIQSLWNLAIEQGFQVEKTYRDDGINGTTLDRPGLNQLLKDARSGEVEAVLVSSPSRISSVSKDLAKIKSELAELGIAIHFIDPSTPKSQLFC
jgi:site-specific DNA recombinase